MAQVRAGFFRNFKSSDTLLLEGDNDGLSLLVKVFRTLAAPTTVPIALRDLPFIDIRHGFQVLMSCSQHDLGANFRTASVIVWARSADGWEEVANKVAVLDEHHPGHQFVDDLSNITVMISAGEYGDTWWQQQG